jgi:rfaE bifunctional protein kinase chain/domain
MKYFSKKVNKKILSVNELLVKIKSLRKKKKIAHCHGTFDIVHPGHLRHLAYSKQKSDILIASITSDKHITKSKEGPYVPEYLRAFNLASLEIVDFVVIDYNQTPLNLLSKLKPNYFVKGFEYKKNNIHLKTREEIKILSKFGGEILFSPGDVVYSSTALQKIEKPNLNYEKLISLMEFEKISFNDLEATIKKFKKIKIHVIGDTIVDKYNYCDVLGQTTKTPTFSVRKNNEEIFLGGAGIVAKHLKKLGADVVFTSVIGNDKMGNYSVSEIKRNKIKHNCLIDPNRSTTCKERFWAANHKLLQVDVVDNHIISDKIKNNIEKIISKTNSHGIIFSDFRHGIFNQETIKEFSKKIRKGTLKIADSQVSNRWGNILDFKNFDLILPNEKEARFSLADQDSAVRQLGTKVFNISKAKYLILKLGERGTLTFRKSALHPRDFFPLESLVRKFTDGIGAGDALLAVASLALIVSKNIVISSILGNIAASVACENRGNKSIDAKDLIKKIKEILNSKS